MCECKVIHIQIPKSNEIWSFLTLLDSISRLTLICFDIGPNSIRYTLTTIYYPSCQQIWGCNSGRVPSYSHTNSAKQSNSIFWTLLDSISRLTLICINVGPNSIRYKLTTIYYPSCQQILGCYIGCV